MKLIEYFEIISAAAADSYNILPLPADSHRINIADLSKIRRGSKQKTIWYRDIGLDTKYFFSTPGDTKGQFTYVEFFTGEAAEGGFETTDVSFQTATASFVNKKIFTKLSIRSKKSQNLQQPAAILNAIVACIKHFHERHKGIKYYSFYGVKENSGDEKGVDGLSIRARVYIRMLKKMGIKKIFIYKKEFNVFVFSIDDNAKIPSKEYEEVK